MKNDKSEDLCGVESFPLEAWALFRRMIRGSAKMIVKAPMNWSLWGWAALVSITAATVLSYVFKAPIHSFFVGDDLGFPEFLADAGKYFGDGGTIAGAAFILLAGGLIARRRTLMETGVALTVAGVWCSLFTLTGQIILSEARPAYGGAMRFFALGGHGVSGHASSAATLFWPIYAILGEPLKKIYRAVLGFFLLSWAGMVAWSRLWDDKHYLWNVILGLSIGFSMGYLAVRTWQLEKYGS